MKTMILNQCPFCSNYSENTYERKPKSISRSRFIDVVVFVFSPEEYLAHGSKITTAFCNNESKFTGKKKKKRPKNKQTNKQVNKSPSIT